MDERAVLYNAGAYQSVEKEYERLYPSLRNRAAFCSSMGMDCTNSRSSMNPIVFWKKPCDVVATR